MAPEAARLVVGIVGAGTMGAGIAQACLTAGHEVVLHDVDSAALSRGRARIADGLERLVAKGRLETATRDNLLAELRQAVTLEALGEEADVVIEAALEQLELKQTVFRALDAAASPGALLTTNTSALSVGAIARATRLPERVVGLHFFNPAPVMPLVEVVWTDLTAPEALTRALDFSAGLGKVPVACRDAPGFIVNRVNRPYTLEALRMLEAGESSLADIDHAMEDAGYPMGPFRLMDLVGIDVNFAVAAALYEAFDHPARFRPSPIQEQLVAAGTLGRKTGSGFYSYQDNEDRSVGQSVPDRSQAPRQLSDAEIVDRIELAIINEAYFAAGEDVASPEDIDRALKLGAHHPRGPFEGAGVRGLRAVVDALARLERVHGERFRVAPALWRMAAF